MVDDELVKNASQDSEEAWSFMPRWIKSHDNKERQSHQATTIHHDWHKLFILYTFASIFSHLINFAHAYTSRISTCALHWALAGYTLKGRDFAGWVLWSDLPSSSMLVHSMVVLLWEVWLFAILHRGNWVWPLFCPFRHHDTTASANPDFRGVQKCATGFGFGLAMI